MNGDCKWCQSKAEHNIKYHAICGHIDVHNYIIGSMYVPTSTLCYDYLFECVFLFVCFSSDIDVKTVWLCIFVCLFFQPLVWMCVFVVCFSSDIDSIEYVCYHMCALWFRLIMWLIVSVVWGEYIASLWSYEQGLVVTSGKAIFRFNDFTKLQCNRG